MSSYVVFPRSKEGGSLPFPADHHEGGNLSIEICISLLITYICIIAPDQEISMSIINRESASESSPLLVYRLDTGTSMQTYSQT